MKRRVMCLAAAFCLLTAGAAQAQTYRIARGSIAKTVFGSGSILAASLEAEGGRLVSCRDNSRGRQLRWISYEKAGEAGSTGKRESK